MIHREAATKFHGERVILCSNGHEYTDEVSGNAVSALVSEVNAARNAIGAAPG